MPAQCVILIAYSNDPGRSGLTGDAGSPIFAAIMAVPDQLVRTCSARQILMAGMLSRVLRLTSRLGTSQPAADT